MQLQDGQWRENRSTGVENDSVGAPSRMQQSPADTLEDLTATMADLGLMHGKESLLEVQKASPMTSKTQEAIFSVTAP